MGRLSIVCASCKGTWPLPGTPTPYVEMQLMTQPCPRCEAYTLSCRPAREAAIVERSNSSPAQDTTAAHAELWRSTEG